MKSIIKQTISRKLILSVLFVFAILAPVAKVTDETLFFFVDDSLYAMFAVSLFASVFILTNKTSPGHVHLTLLDLVILLFFSYIFINWFFTGSKPIEDDILVTLLMLLFYFVSREFFKKFNTETKKTGDGLILLFIVILVIPILISLFEYFDLIPVYSGVYKITGGMLNPGVVAIFIASLLPVVFSAAFLSGNKNKVLRNVAAIVFILSVILILAANSRTAWIACMVSLLYLLFKSANILHFIHKTIDTFRKKLLVALFSVSLIIISSVLLYNLKKDSADGRIFIWKRCIEMFAEKPVSGNGYNSFIRDYGKHQIAYFENHSHSTKEAFRADEVYSAFNDYLQIMAELGSIGLLIFLGILVIAISSKPLSQTGDKKPDKLCAAIKSGLIVVLVSALFSYPLQNVSISTLFFAYLACISSRTRNRFSFRIKRSAAIPIAITTVLITTTIVGRSIYLYRLALKWSSIESSDTNIPPHIILDQYEDLYPFYNSDFSFKFTYGNRLMNNKNTEKALEVFESALKSGYSYDLFCCMAECYLQFNQYEKAEIHLQNASNLIPHKLTPKYLLFTIYKKTKQHKKALHTARLIDSIPVKIYTPEAGFIKSEMIDYISRNTIY